MLPGCSPEVFLLTIYRVKKRDNYVVLDKGFLKDTELTWQAKGLLAYMLSLPNNWSFNMKDLQKRSKNGRDATYRIMKELIEAGYVTRIEKRDEGKFNKVEYIVHEVKQSPHTENQDTELPFPENPDTEKPDTGNPYPENPTLLNNNKLLNNKLNNKEKVVVDEELARVYQFYQENFGVLTHFIGENIAQWVDDLGSELVIEAMKRALKAQKKWNYAEGILQDWFMNNIRTLEDVEAYEIEWKNRQRGRQRAIDQPSTPTPSETESDVREAIERRKRIAKSTIDSEDNSPF